jgi:hypothetical protein
MTMRRLLPALAGLLLFTGCQSGTAVVGPPAPPRTTCTPPAGGRCAADVAWPGEISLSPDGRTLSGPVLCGGTLHDIDSPDRVTLRLHLGAVGPGAMSCARVEVSIRLAEPLGGRPVYDAVSGDRIPVGRAPE